MNNTSIQWADVTVNPLKIKNQHSVIGNYCVKVSPGCAHCYAEKLNQNSRFAGNYLPYRVMTVKPDDLVFLENRLIEWTKVKKSKRIFVCSMTDLFATFWPDEWKFKVLDYCVQSPQHMFLLLTKRAKEMADIITRWLDLRGLSQVPGHILLGISVENQAMLKLRAPLVMDLPATKFMSIEPLLESIDLLPYIAKFDWIIVGGESGKGARPMNASWVRQIRDDCLSHDVPFFFKQWGEWPKNPFEHVGKDGLPIPVGKKAAGRLLDGLEYSAMPKVWEIINVA